MTHRTNLKFIANMLALAGIVDAVLRNYGDAYKVGFDITDRFQMAMNEGIDNYTLVNIADYQNAQAIALKCQEIFYDELKSQIFKYLRIK